MNIEPPSLKKGDRVTVKMTKGGLIPGSDSLGDGTASAEYVSQDGSLLRLKEFWGGRPYLLNSNSLFFVAMTLCPRTPEE